MNFNLIQVDQLNKPQVSGFILEVVHPHTGTPSSIPSGSSNQVLFKSGQFSAGTSLLFVSGKFGFGTSSPSYDLHFPSKSLGAGTGYFDDLFIVSSRVATQDELNLSGQFILESLNSVSGYFQTNFLTSGQINSLYYPRTNPSGYITSGQTGQFQQTGSYVTTGQTGVFVSSGQTGTFITTGQTGRFADSGWVNQYYYPRSNPSGWGVGGGGTQDISFNSGTHSLSITSGSTVSLGIYLTTGSADSRYVQTGNTGLFVTSGQTGDFVTSGRTGIFVTSGQTGAFITNSQTGAFVTTGQTGRFQPSGSYVTTSSTGEFATTGWVNQYYYPRTNPSGYGVGGGGGGGTGIGQVFEFGSSSLTTGQIQFPISFSSAFPSTPIVVGNIENLSSQTMYSFNLSGISTTGFHLVLSDNLTEGCNFVYLATTGAGQYSIGGTPTGSLVARSETGIFSETGKERLISSSVPIGSGIFPVSFSPHFPSSPRVFPSIEVTGDVYYNVWPKNVTVSGYMAVFSDIITENITLFTLAKI